MKVLNDMEVQMVSGGMSLSELIDGIGKQVPDEIGDFFAGLNQLGSDLGIWIYNYTHGC